MPPAPPAKAGGPGARRITARSTEGRTHGESGYSLLVTSYFVNTKNGFNFHVTKPIEMIRNFLLPFMLFCSFYCSTGQNNDQSISGTFTDNRDDHTYKWIRIGSQTWMAENLAWLPAVSPSTLYSNSESYFVNGYEGSTIADARKIPNYAAYGALYNWEAAKTACPAGWHLPKDAEWTALADYMGASPGGKLKEAGTSHWASPNTGATNETGFMALPGGYRSNDGGFESLGQYAYFWSASEYDAMYAWGRLLSYGRNVMSPYQGYKSRGFSVRCLRN